MLTVAKISGSNEPILYIKNDVSTFPSIEKKLFRVRSGKLTWNPTMEVWKIIFLYNWVI